MLGGVGLPRRRPPIGQREPAHREDAGEANLPGLPRALDPLLHLPAGALGGAAADREVRGVVGRVAHPGRAAVDVV